MADYKVTDAELTSIANAIRTKGGTQAQLEFPTGFVNAVNAIPTGGGNVYAFISVSYHQGQICTASNGATTLTAENTSGLFVFAIPNSGSWTIADGISSETVIISNYGQKELVNLNNVTIVSWASGTDEQIQNMISAAHAGFIDLQQDGGWNVGDIRTIELSSFTDGAGNTHSLDTIDIAISSFDNYMNCGCVMQFDFKSSLSIGCRINSTSTKAYGWGATEMKTVTIPALVNALPSWLKNLLIEFSVLGYSGQSVDHIETISGNKLALRSEIEVFGTIKKSIGSGEGSQIPYYTELANRSKTLGKSGQSNGWWTRSPSTSNSYPWIYVAGSGSTSDDYNAASTFGVSPFGCI